MKLDGNSLTLDEIEKFLSGKVKIELTGRIEKTHKES